MRLSYLSCRRLAMTQTSLHKCTRTEKVEHIEQVLDIQLGRIAVHTHVTCKFSKKQESMISKYHTHTPTTNPHYREEEPQNIIRTTIKAHQTALSYSSMQLNWCLLMIIIANSLDPDQNRQNVGADLDLNHLALQWYS